MPSYRAPAFGLASRGVTLSPSDRFVLDSARCRPAERPNVGTLAR